MKMTLRRKLASAAVVLALPAAVLVGSAGSASASAACGKAASDLDHSSYVKSGGGANERSGSSTSCAIKGVAGSGDTLDYYCFTWDSTETYSWTYLRNATDGTYGWVRDDLLADDGSFTYCGF
jgi:uncharacterized membrane protein